MLDFRPAGRWVVQRVLFAVIAPLGRLLGYRPDVPYPGLDGWLAKATPDARWVCGGTRKFLS